MNKATKKKLNKRFIMVGLLSWLAQWGSFYLVKRIVYPYLLGHSSNNFNDTLVSEIYSAATLLSGSLLFLVGRGVDRFGQRKMGIIATVMLGIACLWSSLVANPVMLFIAFFMLRFFGQGSMTLIPNTMVY